MIFPYKEVWEMKSKGWYGSAEVGIKYVPLKRNGFCCRIERQCVIGICEYSLIIPNDFPESGLWDMKSKVGTEILRCELSMCHL